jgi:dihydroorotate dehydrogenase electron transfer subunit
MVWLPGIDEKPISLSLNNEITVKKVGPFTEKLFEKKQGDYLDIRGPYGNSFPGSNRGFITFIGGGCGMAPIVYSFLRYQNFFTPRAQHLLILAGKNKSDILFLDRIKQEYNRSPSFGKESADFNFKKDITIVTEDGSLGKKGLVTDIDIPETMDYHICGPEIMMAKVAEKLVHQGAEPSRIYLSMERYMKCAVGICGNCSFDGYRVCADGPVFSYDKVKDLPHFNKLHRTRTGELIEK